MNEINTWSIKTSLPVEYKIKNSVGIFSLDNKHIASHGNRMFIVIDKKVNELYSTAIEKYLAHNKIIYQIILIEGGETEKKLENLIYILSEIEKFGISRRDEPIIGIGGGVILDLVGLAATLYRRGVPYIRIPTTLLGIVDVSVAAKTGINFEGRRNRLGSYYPPSAAYLDKTFLKTLEPIEISSGLGEILKMAVIKDYSLFQTIERFGKQLYLDKFDCDCSDEVINKSVQGMVEELENNLWEKDLKRCVDFGHSFSPLIEMKSLNTQSPLTHGQAVTLDVIFSSIISYNRELLSRVGLIRIIRTAKNMGLPTIHDSFLDAELLFESLQDTVKHRNGEQNLPVPNSIGKYIFLNDLSFSEIKQAVKYLTYFNKSGING